jgi:hypothetical protein
MAILIDKDSIVIFSLSPYSEEMECVMIQMLQKIYIDCVNDLASEKYDLQEDIESIKKRRKAAKRLLWYYMTPSDLEDFFNSVKTGSSYVFNAKTYLQS